MKKLIIILYVMLSGINSANSSELVTDNYYNISDWQCWGIPNITPKAYNFYALPYDSSGKQDSGEYTFPPAKYGGTDMYNCEIVTSRNVGINNHRPEASFFISQENQWLGGTNRVTISSTSTDIDENLVNGNITKYEWWVNGVKQTSSTNSIRIFTINGGHYTIKLKVIDSGTIKYDTFTSGKVINFGDPIFFLSDIHEKTVYLEPWSCGGPGCMPY